MLWVPQKGIVRVEHNLGTVGSIAPGTVCVTDASSSATKGTAVELIAATAFDAYWVRIMAGQYGGNAVASQGCLDILVGAATEEVLIPNLLMGFSGSFGAEAYYKQWEFPLYIPAGTRIAAQTAGDRLATNSRVAIVLYGGSGYPPFRVGSKVTTYGITTVPAGTDVAAGYSGAEGAWVQITASTSENHFAFVPSYHPTDGDTTFGVDRSVFMDLGIGAATEELLGGVEQSYIFSIAPTEKVGGPLNSMPTFADVPSGTRLVARLSYSGATDTGEPDCAIHAVS